MKTTDYQNSLKLESSPSQVFKVLTQQIGEWWSKSFEGSGSNKDDVFTVHFGPTFKTMRITNIVKNKKVEWQCINQHIETPPGIPPLKNKKEWVGNTILWEITETESLTILNITHYGLTPMVECYGICEQGWNQSLESIEKLIKNGTGKPFVQLDEEHLKKAINYQNNYK